MQLIGKSLLQVVFAVYDSSFLTRYIRLFLNFVAVGRSRRNQSSFSFCINLVFPAIPILKTKNKAILFELHVLYHTHIHQVCHSKKGNKAAGELLFISDWVTGLKYAPLFCSGIGVSTELKRGSRIATVQLRVSP